MATRRSWRKAKPGRPAKVGVVCGMGGWWGGRRRRAAGSGRRAAGSGRGIVQRAAWLCSNLAQRTEPGNVEEAQELKLDRRECIRYV